MNTQNKETTLDNISKTAMPIHYHMITLFAEILMKELKNPDSQIHRVLLWGFQEIAKDLAREVEALNKSMDHIEENIMESYTQEIYQFKKKLKTTTRRISEIGTNLKGMLSDTLRRVQYVSTLEKLQQEWEKNLTPNGNKMMRLFLQIIKDIEKFLREREPQKTQKQQIGYPPPRSWTGQTQPARDTQRGYGYEL